MATTLGIDLGTTNSSCAFFDGREVTLIPNDRGSRTTPSVIACSDRGEILVGESARNQALIHPDRTVLRAKREMGSPVTFPFGVKSITPEVAAAAILSRLKADAEAYLNEEARAAVITVPAYFSEAQRRATREAGRAAGLEVRRLLNEPTAAALAWAWSFNRSNGKDDRGRTVLVYDLGGGTFDATVLAMEGDDCRVLAACGDNHLGGADFDELLLDRAIAAFERELGPGVFTHDLVLRQQLSDLCERAKIELSFRDSASIVLPFAGGGRSHPFLTVSRDEFERLIGPLIDRTIALVQQVIGEAALDSGGIDALVLSGGSSRIPLVRRLLKQTLGREPEGRINPEEAVAYGAAVFAASTDGSAGGLRVEDALSRSFGLEIDHDEFISLIPKNTPIPVARKRTFTTVADDQPSVEIHVLQGESPRASDNLSLGRFLLTGIRSGKKGEPRIEVEFSVDSDEILHVRARDLDTGTSQAVTISAHPEGGPSAGIERLRNLASRAASLASAAAGDRAFEAEIAQAVADVERLAGAGEHPSEADRSAALISLEAIVAELDARRSAGG